MCVEYYLRPHVFIIFFLISSSFLVAKSSLNVKEELADESRMQQVSKNSIESAEAAQSLVTLSRQQVDLIHFFSKPIEFTTEGIEYFFKYVYNHSEYANYLPYSMSHMIQFLQYGTQTGQSEQFAASVLKMFLQKMKAAPYVQAEAFVEFIPKFAQAMQPYLEKKQANFLTEMQVIIKEKLTNIFSQYFSYFQKNPDGFMHSLAEQIVKQTNQSATKQHVEVEQLKKDVLRFFEIAANKLVWAAQDDVEVWQVCNRLADECAICVEAQVLPNQDSLDDLCWSIIHRFCYFLDLFAGSLSSELYEQILNDLKHKPDLTLIKLQEQEDLMRCKHDYLQYKVQACKELP